MFPEEMKIGLSTNLIIWNYKWYLITDFVKISYDFLVLKSESIYYRAYTKSRTRFP